MGQPVRSGEPERDGRVAHPHGLRCLHEIAFTTSSLSLTAPKGDVSDGLG